MLSILSSLAESESVSISENEKWGIKRRFQNGTFIISYPPYGYDNVASRCPFLKMRSGVSSGAFRMEPSSFPIPHMVMTMWMGRW